MGRGKKFSHSAYTKCFDADFQTVMKSVGFNGTPREEMTVSDCLIHYVAIQNLGLPRGK